MGNNNKLKIFICIVLADLFIYVFLRYLKIFIFGTPNLEDPIAMTILLTLFTIILVGNISFNNVSKKELSSGGKVIKSI